MKKLALLLALSFCLALVGCGQSASSEKEKSPAPREPLEIEAAAVPPDHQAGEPSPREDEETLYIGTKAGGFREYPMAYEGELTPEGLIQGIADLTGWDLTLAESVTSGKGGMSVCLSGESSLFTGPPDPQKEEFHMYDAGQLAETILDSIQKTLQMAFTGQEGDPDALDIWYCMEGEQPLELPALGLSWPMDRPYQWAEANCETNFE